MNCILFLVRVLVVAIVVSGLTIKSLAQTSSGDNPSQGTVVLTKLAQPVYPPLARQARITGDVELKIEVGKDGTVQSAVAVSAHPILKQAALDSAQQSQFECQNCTEAAVPVQLVYTFQLGQPGQVFPHVIHTEKHVTLFDRPACICDARAPVRKVRSLKCLCLWRCGFPRLISYE